MKSFIKSLTVLMALAMVFAVANVVNAEQEVSLQKDFVAASPTPVVTPVSTPVAVVVESRQGDRIAAPTPTPTNPSPTPVVTVVVSQQGQPVVPAQTPSTPSTPATTVYGSSGGSSGGYYAGVNSFVGSSCPVVTTLLKKGNNNNSAEVTKLQTFLKNVEKSNVDINGKFDEKTEAAVIAFQNKYKDVILAPWGATKASGVVYITTASKINSLVCGRPMTLSASDLATINSYNGSVENNSTNSVVSPAQVQVETPSPSVNAGEVGVKVGPESNTANTASAANTSVFGSFWKFVRGLFSSKK